MGCMKWLISKLFNTGISSSELEKRGLQPYSFIDENIVYNPKCDVCHQCFPTNEAGRVESLCHPFWSQKYCPSREHDNTARCCCCERLEARGTKYMLLGDGRHICLECMESAIMDTGDCQPLYHAIKDYYVEKRMKIDQGFPVLLVERQGLNEAVEGEKHCFHHRRNARGLCSSEDQTVIGACFSEEHTELRETKVGRRRIEGIRTKPVSLIRRCEVTAILVLYGLPRLVTGAILAHELMHAWLRLHGYRNLRPEVEEGICHVLSHMWLESEVIPTSSSMASSSSTWPHATSPTRMASSSSAPSLSSSSSKKGRKHDVVENKLGEFFMHQIVNDTSPDYGGGYRAAMVAVNKYGLYTTLDYIRNTGDFPE